MMPKLWRIDRRGVFFILLAGISLLVFWPHVLALVQFSLKSGHQYDQYSHTVLIPFVSLGLIYIERKRIFANVRYGLGVGGVVVAASVTLGWLGRRFVLPPGSDGLLSFEILSLTIFWVGAFIFCYGTKAVRAGVFPLMFLLVMVPLPSALLDFPVAFVQHGSAGVTSVLFDLAGVPVLRSGFEFSLPGISIEVAKECSGIHSTLALFIVSLLAGHFFLSSRWKKVALVLFTLPIVCVTNGLRIALLTLLAVYVDASFLHGNLHRVGGIGFFLVAVSLLFGILWVLRWREHPASLRGDSAQGGTRALASHAKS
jgi:exosortase